MIIEKQKLIKTTLAEFLNEKVDDNNLYHFTNLESLYEIIKDGSILPFHDKMMDDGISTTRNKNLKWLRSNVRLTFDKNELSKRYKIKPFHWFNMKHNWDKSDDYRKYGQDIRPNTNQNIPANQYEERIVTDKPLPISYIKEIEIIRYIPKVEFDKLKRITNIPIKFPSYINENILSVSTSPFKLYDLLKSNFEGIIDVDRPYDSLYETIDISITDLTKTEDIISFVNSHNWYVSKNSLHLSNRIEIKPIFSSGKVEKIPTKLYHASQTINIISILNNGIKPKSQDIRHKYPPRIYVTDNIPSLYGLIKEMKRWKDVNEFSILEIDTSGLNIALYKDITSAYKGCYYIQGIDKIPTSSLKLIKDPE
jgi:hypothetical protein